MRRRNFDGRFGGALNLNFTFHSLVLDGVYEVLPGSRGVRFLELPPPDTSTVLRVLADAVERLASALKRIGFGDDEGGHDRDDELARENPVLAAQYAAAVGREPCFGPARSAWRDLTKRGGVAET